MYTGVVLSQPTYRKFTVRDGLIYEEMQSPALPGQFSEDRRTYNPLNYQQGNVNSGGAQKTFTATGAINVTATTTGTTCGSSTGSIIVTASGGTPPYKYIFNNGFTQNNGNFHRIAPGTYPITVKDAAGESTTISVTIINTNDPPRLVISSYTPASGCATQDATATLTATGGTPPYQYSSDGINYQASNIFTNMYPGYYIFFVKDANGCTAAYDNFFEGHFVNAACSEPFGYSFSLVICLMNGEITLNPGNQAFTYTYSLDGINYQGSNTFTNLPEGIYVVFIKNSAGKIRAFRFQIFRGCNIQVDFISIDAACGQNDGGLTVTASLGTAPYTYSIDGINFQSGNTFTGLTPGLYTVTVRDANGVEAYGVGNVYDKCPTVTAVAADETCTKNDGTITATGNKGSTPYTFSIDGINYQAGNVFTGLTSGTYTVYLKDAMGFTATTTATIGLNCVTCTATATDEACGQRNGTITATASLGTGPYLYSIDGVNYLTINHFFNLPAGVYTVSAKDIFGKIGSTSITINNIPPATVTSSTSPSSCQDNDGTIIATGSGGKTPYQYSINGTQYQSANIFNNLTSGVYTIYIKDGNGCINTTAATVISICPVSVTAVATDGKCTNNGGSITVTGSHGSPPYLYSIDGTNFQNGNIFSGLTTGPYTITIKDAGGVTATATVNVKNFPGPVLTANTLQATCLNNNGGIDLSSTSGTMPLLYSKDGTNFQAGQQFRNLAAGSYTTMVRDANGCTDSKPVVIVMVNDLTLTTGGPVTICEGDKITLPATSNGTTFSWTNSSMLDNSAALNPKAFPVASITFTITAKLGVCQQSASVNVNVNPAPVADAGENVTICFGKDAVLSGSGGISYQWKPAMNLDDPQSPSPVVRHPQNSVTYSLVVTDNNGCHSLNDESVNVTVTPPAKIFAGNDTTVSMNRPFQLLAQDVNNSGFTSYSWTPPLGLSDPAIKNPIAVLDRNMQFTVTGTTPAGCEGIDVVNIKVIIGPDIYVPNAFTPNNNRKNDIFRSIPIGIKDFQYLAVFNRWGERIFYSTDPSTGWDGTYRGIAQSSGIFVWMVQGISDEGKVIKKKGTVMLIR